MSVRPRAAEPRLLALRENLGGRRLDRVLAQWLQVSRAEARRLLARGEVRLDGRCLGPGDKGKPVPARGELRVEGFVPPAERRPPAPCADEIGPGWLVSGPGWLALDKPAGMPVHPLRPGERGSALAHALQHCPGIRGVGEGGLRSGVVHRLDVQTSGVLLFGCDEASWRRLRRAFSAHRVEKTYRALVVGDFELPDGCVVEQEFGLRVARHRPARVRVVPPQRASDPGVRRVRQSVRVLERFVGASLLEIRPRTGFLHQIRATLAHLGHPVVGDRIYAHAADSLGPDRVEAAGIASGSCLRDTNAGVGERAATVAEHCGAARHLLHAARLRFEEIDVSAPDAADFAACLARLATARRTRSGST